MPLSQDQLAALIQASITKNTGGAAPGDAVPSNRPMLANPASLQVTPPKPDPEAAATQMIRDSIAKSQQQNPAQSLRSSTQGAPPASNGVNPDTGMPYYSPQAPKSQADQDRANMTDFKMQYLRNKAAQGQ